MCVSKSPKHCGPPHKGPNPVPGFISSCVSCLRTYCFTKTVLRPRIWGLSRCHPPTVLTTATAMCRLRARVQRMNCVGFRCCLFTPHPAPGSSLHLCLIFFIWSWFLITILTSYGWVFAKHLEQSLIPNKCHVSWFSCQSFSLQLHRDIMTYCTSWRCTMCGFDRFMYCKMD